MKGEHWSTGHSKQIVVNNQRVLHLKMMLLSSVSTDEIDQPNSAVLLGTHSPLVKTLWPELGLAFPFCSLSRPSKSEGC